MQMITATMATATRPKAMKAAMRWAGEEGADRARGLAHDAGEDDEADAAAEHAR